MTDIVTPAKRSAMMRGIRNRHTRPEMALRRLLHAAGFRYRLHKQGLPGTPDLWLARYRAVIEVNGCFWHGHDCHLARPPRSRQAFWLAKIGANRARDQRHRQALAVLAIRRLTIWECALKGRTRHDPARLVEVIGWWLASGEADAEIAGGCELRVLPPL